jgi:predicted nucleic acid-binding protein
MITDTGVVYAAMDRGDPSHPACVELLRQTGDPVVVPSPVLVELDWIGDARGVPVLEATLAAVESGAIEVLDLSPADYARVRELCRQYSDLRLGLVDASVVAVAERLGEQTIATLDHRHFSVVRPRHIASFTLVPGASVG